MYPTLGVRAHLKKLVVKKEVLLKYSIMKTHPRVRGPITGCRTRPLLGVGGGGRLVEVLVGGEAAGVAGEGEATEGVTGY